MFKKIWPIIILIILLLPLIYPLFHSGFFVTDDGDWMVIRLAAFHSTLRTGQFPVRYLYSLNHGFGYPVLNFNYPLPFYFGEAIHLLGFSFINSVKILFGLSFIFSALGMYYLVSKELGKWSGLIAAVFYSYAPYRIFDVYHRGSLGEAVAFVFLPLIFLFLKRNLSLAALSYAALITSHNIVAFLFSPVLLAYLAIKIIQSNDRLKVFLQAIVFYILSITSSAFFWLPAIFDLQYTRTLSAQVSDFNNYFLSAGNFLQVLGFLIPAVLICSTILIFFRKKSRPHFILIFTILSLFFVLPVSLLIWQSTPLPKLIQFPWRFLSITVFGSAILAGFVFSFVKKPYLFILGCLLIIFFSLPLIKTQPTNKPDSFYSTNDDSTTIKNEYMPKWLSKAPTQRPDKKILITKGVGMVKADNLVDMRTVGKITIHSAYFPGIKVAVNDKDTNFSYIENGELNVSLSPGISKVEVLFTETPLRFFANIVSAISLVVVLVMLIYYAVLPNSSS